MRILIMDAGRGTTGVKVELWRERLGLEPHDAVALLSWHAPKEPLPVVTHLVAGPAFHLGREPRRWQTASAATALGHARAADRHDPLTTIAEPGQPMDELSEQFADDDALAVTDRDDAIGADSADATDAAEATGSRDAAVASAAVEGLEPDPGDEPQPTVAPPHLSSLSRTDPRRLLHGLRWRGNKVRLGARRRYRRGRSRLRRADEPTSRAVRSVLRMRGSGIPNEFALAVARSHEAARLFNGADVVVPVDDLTPRAAWLLARRCPRPDVIHTFHAAKRVIAARRARDEAAR